MDETNRLGRVKSEKKDNDTVDGAFREAAGKGETVKMGLMFFFRKKKKKSCYMQMVIPVFLFFEGEPHLHFFSN